MSGTAAARYVMGHNDRERRRLMLQASLINPITEQLFRRAGIGPGTRVLDVGCGVGDVALISARLGADVTGVDIDESALGMAGERAQAEGLANVRFLASDVHTLDLPHTFDAITGRHILIHVPDPLGFLQVARRFLKPGAMAVFQEYDFSVIHPAYPEAPVRESVFRIFDAFFRRFDRHSVGTRLYRILTDAGFTQIDCRAEYPLSGDPDSGYHELCVESLRSVLPRLEALDIVKASELDIDTLEERMLAESRANGSVWPLPAMVGAFGFWRPSGAPPH
jgi:2-polyprenyl-3-methyl-5-hydroxy-6-metoxy-1,4-benzoquinol methylase